MFFMEEKNNFKQAYEREAPEHLQKASLNNAQESVRTVRSVLEVLDLYISKFFEAIIHPFKDSQKTEIPLVMGVGLEDPEMNEDKPESGKKPEKEEDDHEEIQ